MPEGALIASQSTFESMNLSPCRVTERPKGVRIPPSEKMFGGTVQHAMIEDYMAGNLTRLRAASPSTVMQYASKLAQEEGWTLPEILPSNTDVWASSYASLLSAFIVGPYAEELHEWQLLEAEQPRAIPIATLSNGQDFWLATGGIDYIGRSPTDGVVGVDFKTAGRGWGQNDGPGRIQHNAYALLAYEDYGLIDDWRYLVGNVSRSQWEWHQARVTPASLVSVRNQMVEWAEYLVMPNRPTLCTPYQGKQRGWWAKPAFNDGWCLNCRYLGDAVDDDPAWGDTFAEKYRRDQIFRERHTVGPDVPTEVDQ